MTHVLLIEDDRWLAELEARVLDNAGYTVSMAANALEAVDKVDESLPDVIIADVLMAGSTIFPLLHELQSYSDTYKIPVVLCTNIAEQFSLETLGSYGVRRIVDKSVMEPADIVAAVKAVL